MDDCIELDEKMRRLAVQYKMEQLLDGDKHHKKMTKGYKWAKTNILDNINILAEYSDDNFARTFREIFSNFNGHIAIRRFPVDNIKVNKIRGDFVRGVKYLLDDDEDIYTKVDNLVNGEYKVRDLGFPVWSFLAGAKDPNAPIMNQMIVPFFDEIGVDIGKGKTQMEKVKQHYDRWVDNYNKNHKPPKIDYIDIDHMIWWLNNDYNGKRHMDRHFGSNRK